MKKEIWKNKSKRFVLFFDILGFKEMTANSSHNAILAKLNKLKKTSEFLTDL